MENRELNNELYMMKEEDINKFSKFLVDSHFENNLIKYIFHKHYCHKKAIVFWKALLKIVYEKGFCLANDKNLEIVILVISDTQKTIKTKDFIKKIGIKNFLSFGLITLIRLNHYLTYINKIKKFDDSCYYVIGTASIYRKNIDELYKNINEKMLEKLREKEKCYYKIARNDEIFILENLGFKTKIIKLIPKINLVYGLMVKNIRN